MSASDATISERVIMRESDLNRDIVEANNRLNDLEYREGKIILESYPRAIFMQIDAPCNQDCLFCSRPENYSYFNLEKFRRDFEAKLETAMSRAERMLLTGSGELLCLPEAKKNLQYFNRYKYAEKMFATNGSTLTPKMLDFLIESQNRYTIHVSMHSADKAYHRIMTKSDTYDVVMENIAYLKKVKKDAPGLTVNLIFLMTTENIDNLPDFISFAEDIGADGVVAYYNYVYRQDQKYLSCYFAKAKTNAVIDMARAQVLKSGSKLRLTLPPKFDEKEYKGADLCGEAWSQIMINPGGDIITCDVAGDSRETLVGKEFMEVWNGNYLTNIRKKLSSGDRPCSKYCFRANPSCVNDFRSHIITRGKSEEEIEKFIKE